MLVGLSSSQGACAGPACPPGGPQPCWFAVMGRWQGQRQPTPALPRGRVLTLQPGWELCASRPSQLFPRPPPCSLLASDCSLPHSGIISSSRSPVPLSWPPTRLSHDSLGLLSGVRTPSLGLSRPMW